MERISFCKRCGKDFAWIRKICPHCGQHENKPLPPPPVPCEHCGTPNAPECTLCSTCGLQRGEPIVHRIFRLAGVTHPNADGTSRQLALEGLRDVYGEAAAYLQLVLWHEEDNPADPNAVEVQLPGKKGLGYLPAARAAEVVRYSRAGCKFSCYLLEVVGGWIDAPTYGANVLLLHCSPRATVRDLEAYIKGRRLDQRP